MQARCIRALVLLSLALPVTVVAGNLEPPAAPAPTMRTLEEIYDKVVAVSLSSPLARFSLNPGYDTITDNWSKLTWARSPLAIRRTWNQATTYISGLSLGGKSDWRMPTKEELLTVVDITQQNPALPVGHPFLDVQNSLYWTSSLFSGYDTTYYYINLYTGSASYEYLNGSDSSFTYYVWPVRGGL